MVRGAVVMPSSSVRTAPPTGSLKLNIDVGFNQSELKETATMVVRDSFGNIVLSTSQGFKGVLTPLQAEFRAILMRLEVSYCEGIHVRYVKTNSLLVVQEILKGTTSTSEQHSLIFDIIRFKELCNIFSFKFIRRDANVFVHNIAKAHDLHDYLYVWHYGCLLLLLFD